MFDSVSRKDFDTEHALRLAAEARELAANRIIEHLTSENTRLVMLVDRQAERHEVSERDLRDRFAPLPAKPGESSTEVTPMTAEQIRSQPAHTRREMLQRDRAAREAERREQTDDQRKAIDEREKRIHDSERERFKPKPPQDDLTEDEQRFVDDLIGTRPAQAVKAS